MRRLINQKLVRFLGGEQSGDNYLQICEYFADVQRGRIENKRRKLFFQRVLLDLTIKRCRMDPGEMRSIL